MIKLSERLQKIAACIEPGETVADIGTDHGLLPIFLFEHAISPKLVLCDINAGPLEKAKKNIETMAPSFLADLRQGDGISLLEKGETDVIVIAGMGGELISAILEEDLKKSRSFSKWIFQPRTASEKLRETLFRHDFAIVDELLAKERGRICEIIVAVPAPKKRFTAKQKESMIGAMEKDLVFEISSLMLLKKDPLLEPFLLKKIQKEREIIKNITENGRNISYLKAESAKKRIAGFEALVEQIRKDSRKD